MGFVGSASRRHERAAVLQDPAKSLATVVAIFNDKHMHAIKAAEVCVHEPHPGTLLWLKVRQRARRMEERG